MSDSESENQLPDNENQEEDERKETTADSIDDIISSSKNIVKSVSEEERTKQKIFISWIGDESRIMCNNPLILSLPHPKQNGKSSKFMLCNEQLLEIQRASDDPSSWFVDNTVQQDGSIYFTTPVDPLFIFLPLLEDSRKQTEEHEGYYCPISQMLLDSKNSHYLQLNSIVKSTDLSLVCDTKGDDDELRMFRLNDDKVLQWLRCKVERLKQLVTASPDLIPGAQAASFRSTTKKALTPNDILQISMGFISEYVHEKWLTRVAKSYGVSLPTSKSKLTSPNNDGSLTAAGTKHNIDKKEKQKPKLTPAQNKLAKVNLKGMSKLDTYFVKQVK